ncbi:hypothetical protein ACFVVM_08070 [Nocardia sp. NPDC058176]|uniref:hypothetical protein n=1 Tax=Nocardia sp. NPDC058176 TaxID=3346368 RepID=UPI0036DD35A5
MGTEVFRARAGVAFVSVALAAGTVAGIGEAAAQTGGIQLAGVANDNCTATITLTNYTNSRFFQPDWWFAEENDLEMVDATGPVADMPPPWRAVPDIPWPIARWVGDPPLHSGVPPEVPSFPDSPYNRNAQPDGNVTQATIDLRAVDGAPTPSADGTMTIYFRVKTGPQTADRLPNPQELIVGGCASNGGGSHGSGSADWGSSNLGSTIP